MIEAGEADVVVAGGADAGICEGMFASLSNMGPLSQRNDDPQAASRPFDADRDGFVFGEGAVVMVLESPAHAAAREATVYGEVAGGARTRDGFHMSAPEPSGRYAATAISLALERAGIRKEELGYICAHGTSTIANDLAETRAIRLALGEAADRVPISSPKSMVGHLIGAAGTLSVMVCLLAMRDSLVPPTINLERARSRLRPRLRARGRPRALVRYGHLERLRLRGPELRRRCPAGRLNRAAWVLELNRADAESRGVRLRQRRSSPRPARW